eukprot:4771453-Amphidinium_carterae.1
MPVSMWDRLEGMPETTVLAEDTDLYFHQRVVAAGYNTSWMACDNLCSFSSKSRWTDRWRVGPAYGKPGPRTLAPHLDVFDVEKELYLLQQAGASAGVDTSCRWGLVGQTVFHETVERDAASGMEASGALHVPFLGHGGDQQGYPGILQCATDAAQQKAWQLWRSRAIHAKPLLVVRVQGGLGNRMRAFASGWALAEALDYFYAVIWEPDVECGATFHELFEGSEAVLVLDFPPWGSASPGSGWAEYDGLGLNKRIVLSKSDSENTNVYVRTQNFISSTAKAYKLEDYAMKLASLYPRGKDMRLIYRYLLEKLDMPHVIGVHVRMVANESAHVFGTDKQLAGLLDVHLQNLNWQGEEARKGLFSRRAKCHWSNFLGPINKELQYKPSQNKWRILVACDDMSCLEGFRNVLGEKVVSIRDFLPAAYFKECE